MKAEARTDYERYLLVRAQAWAQELAAFDSGVVANVLAGMKRIRRDAEAQIAALDLSDAADVLDAERLRRLEAWLDSVTAAASSVVSGTALEAGVSAAMATAAATGAALTLDGAFGVFQDVGLTREQMALWFGKSPLVDGYDLKALTKGMTAQMKAGTMEALQSTVTLGESVGGGVRRLLSRAAAEGFSLGERGAVSIVRTAIQAGAVQAMDAVYQQNSALFSGWRWVAKLDSRTCIRCAALDGKVFPLGKGPRMPAHPRCRCLRQPILKKEAELGAPDEDVQRLTRTWVEREAGNVDMGGRRIIVTERTDRWFGEFWKDMRTDLQDAMVGRDRAAALRAGRIRWADIVDGEGRVRTLKTLGIKGYAKAQMQHIRQ